MPSNYYQVIGVSQTASEAEIKASYRKLAMKLHPDSNPDPSAHAQFLKLNEAYQTLSDPHLRYHYDRQLQRFQAGDQHAFQKRRPYRQPPPQQQPAGEPPQMSDEERERRYREAKIKKEKGHLGEFRQYTPYVRIASILGLIWVGILLADWALTTPSAPELIQNKIRLATHYEIITASRKIEVPLNRWDYVAIGEEVTTYTTPLFRTTYRMGVTSQFPSILPTSTPQAHTRHFHLKPGIYNIFSFFWVLVIITSIGGLLTSHKPEIQFRMGLGTVGLLVLNLIILLIS